MYLAAPSGQGSRKGGPRILHVHRTGEAKLRDSSLCGVLSPAQAAIDAGLPLAGLDEPVVHPRDFLDRPAEDLLIERGGSVDIIRLDIEMHDSIGHGLLPPKER